MTLEHLKDYLIDTFFVSGFVGSNVMAIMRICNIHDVNEYLHFAVLAVTLSLGVIKLVNHHKGKGDNGHG